ncbi:hypothetical protein chiPu_0016288 [Chiloscyllium punctatum]|uniref:Uncharacterized protein n=1 Tax=Chiloscyllium punctatum TaxID=137246 RepID=A0A401T546_CHIPU|nr:hypothetical protein [Chiloscyllium punctatum]
MQKCSRSSSVHSSSSASCHSNKKAAFPTRPPATAGSQCSKYQKQKQLSTTPAEIAENSCYRVERGKAMPDNLKFQGVHDLNTTYEITYQPLPIEKQNPPSKKRAKPKSATIESMTTYRKDYPIYTAQALRRRPLIFQVDNLRINRHLPVDFNTIQRDSFIGWDTNKYPRRDPIILKNQLKLEGTIDTNTVTKLTYTEEPFNDVQDLNRPMTMQSACGGKFHSGTAYTNSFRPWEMRSRVRHGDLHDGAYVPPPGKIDNTTITKQDFTPKNVCEPKDSTGQKTNSWTVRKEASSPARLPMCRLEAYLLYQRLKGMKISRPPSVAMQ